MTHIVPTKCCFMLGHTVSAVSYSTSSLAPYFSLQKLSCFLSNERPPQMNAQLNAQPAGPLNLMNARALFWGNAVFNCEEEGSTSADQLIVSSTVISGLKICP